MNVASALNGSAQLPEAKRNGWFEALVCWGLMTGLGWKADGKNYGVLIALEALAPP